jgi:cytoskeleton protein RodZ
MGKAVYGTRGSRPRAQPGGRPNGRARDVERPVSIRLEDRPVATAADRAAHAMNFGDHLRAAREARGLSLREISARTRIALRSLEALEHNEIGKLPGGIFSRAFVRAYAHEVGLDADDSVRLFVQQFPIDHITAGTTDAVEGEIGRGQVAQRQRQRLGLLLTAAIGIPLLGLSSYLVSSARRPASASDLSVGAPPAVAAGTVAPSDGHASPGAGANASAATGTAAGSASPSSTLASTSKSISSATEAKPGTLPTPDSLRILISADGPCWVRFRGDGNVHFQGLLQAGDKQTGDAHDNVDLVIGDAAMFRYSINGQTGRVLGKPGQVVVAHITRANWQEWLQR